ncbi:MAG: alpha/beta hydrolase [Acidimicrobiales bacterium]
MNTPLVVHELGGRGPVLVMVHATGLHGRVWGPVADHLVGSFRCLAPDVRGHGGSVLAGPGGGPMPWPRLAGDLLEVIDALELSPVFGLGHSLGASLLLLAEQARPGTFAGLYCVEPIGVTDDHPPPPNPDHPMVTRAAARRDDFASRAAALATYGAKPPFSSVDPAALAVYVEYGFADAPDGTVRLRCRPADEAAVFTYGLSHPVFGDLAKVVAPVTLAVGGSSTAVSVETMALWADRLPHGRVEVLEGLGHFAPLEDPRRVAASVAAALA